MAMVTMGRFGVFVAFIFLVTMLVLLHTTAMIRGVDGQPPSEKLYISQENKRVFERHTRADVTQGGKRHISQQGDPIVLGELDQGEKQKTSTYRKFLEDGDNNVPKQKDNQREYTRGTFAVDQRKSEDVKFTRGNPSHMLTDNNSLPMYGRQTVEIVYNVMNATKTNHTVDPPWDTHVQECPARYITNRARITHYNKIRQQGQTPSRDNGTSYNILILTPISDSVDKLLLYFTLLCSLTYPRQRISIALGEDSSQDGTFEAAVSMALDVRGAFRDVTVYKLAPREYNWLRDNKHDQNHQFRRRRHLAKARNDLLMRAIRQEHDLVLWLDSDIAYYPPDVIQLLLSPRESIVVPVCLMKTPGSGFFRVFDKNTWRETNNSIHYLATMTKRHSDFLMLEGYGPTKRLYLSDLRQEGLVVPVDGIGGCVLLINATCHRQGLVFPSFIFDAHIETEGLGKMATRMGIKMYGLPFVSVIHT